MKWRREIDYHSSRLYSAEERPAGMLSVAIGWIAGAARRTLRELAARPTPATRLIARQRGFSTLGADSRRAMPGDAARCPFPIKAEPADRRDWRVLP
jgi:hypothetical protein